jgi:hypothetical protein
MSIGPGDLYHKTYYFRNKFYDTGPRASVIKLFMAVRYEFS